MAGADGWARDEVATWNGWTGKETLAVPGGPGHSALKFASVMQHAQRIITVAPIHELWDDRGTVDASRSRHLAADELRELLCLGPLRFVVVEVGSPPRWAIA
jgi:hypothetical protein